MIQRVLTHCLSAVLLILTWTACSPSSEYTYVIPSDASTVVGIQLESLFKKAGWTDKDMEVTRQQVLEALKEEMNAATYQQLEKIFLDPSASGIDPQAPVYAFSSPSLANIALLARVKKVEDLQNSLHILVKEKITGPIEEGNGFSYVTLSDNLLAFNEHSILMVECSRKSLRAKRLEAIAQVFQQTPEKSFAASGAFKQLSDESGDVCFYNAAHSLGDMGKELTQLLSGKDLDARELAVVGNLNLEKGKIRFSYAFYTENEEMLKLLKKQEEVFEEPKGCFLKLFPASTLFFAQTAIDGEKCYAFMQNNPNFRQETSIAKAELIQQALHSFEGDLAMGLLNINMNESPSCVIYAEVNDDRFLRNIYEQKEALQLKKGEKIVQLNEKEYVLKGREETFFFGVKDRTFYWTNDESVYKHIGKAEEKSIRDTAFGREIDDHALFLALHVEAFLDLPIVKMALNFSYPKVKKVIHMLEDMTYITLKNDPKKGELEICFRNQDENILQQLMNQLKLHAVR